MDIKASVVIPVFNGQDTLAEQLDAVLGQETSFPFEVIVADNGSTDDTPSLLRRYAKSDHRLCIVDASQKRGGAHAKNVGVEHARSDTIVFADADDVVNRGWLESMVRATWANDVTSAMRDYSRLNEEWKGRGRQGIGFFYGVPIVSGGVLGISKSLYQEVGGFDAVFAGAVDTEFSLRLYQRRPSMPVVVEDAAISIRLRGTFQDRLRRHYLLQRSRPLLVSRYRTLLVGAKPLQGLRMPLGLARRPHWLLQRGKREVWLKGMAGSLGRIVGSIEHRYLFL